MATEQTIHLDAVILGGGIAGLWTLRKLVGRGHQAILIERSALGTGQTLWSQGIIHGGLKYTLGGKMNQSAQAIREMPARWRACLEGEAEPQLPNDCIRAPHCHLWRTTTLRSRAGMIGARVGLRTAPVMLTADERPEVLRDCPGAVARLDEIVVDPGAVLEALAAPVSNRIIQVEREQIESMEIDDHRVRLVLNNDGSSLAIDTRTLILTAGAGNAPLREQLGLSAKRMQIRPLHMIMLRGKLPVLNGHCVDGARTRVTISCANDSDGRTVWQIGGEITERGVSMEPPELIEAARTELTSVIPGLDLSDTQWATYRADRAEGRTPGSKRPEDLVMLDEGPIISAWPTKLALAPRLADRIASILGKPAGLDDLANQLKSWPSPKVALPPWEETASWIPDAQVAGTPAG